MPDDIEEPRQRCPRCRQLLPYEAFTPSYRGRQGHYCRECAVDYRASWLEERTGHRPERRASTSPPARRAPGKHYGADRTIRPDQADPAAWTPARDGTWRSPGGRRFKHLPEGVASARIKLGLPMSWAESMAAPAASTSKRRRLVPFVDAPLPSRLRRAS